MVNSTTERILYTSSSEVYGKSDTEQLYKEDVLHPLPDGARSDYPRAKLAGEELAIQLREQFKLKVVICRLFHTYGPGVRQNDGRSFADFIWNCAKGRKPELYSDGSQVRTFLYSEDAISAFLLLLSGESTHSIFNVGSESPLTIRQLAETVATCAGVSGVSNVKKLIDFEQSKTNKIVPDISRIKNLGWRESTSLEGGINRTLNWAKTQLV